MRTRTQRWLTLAMLYAIQGLAFGAWGMALKNWLAEQGLAPDTLGTLVAVVGLPMALKIVWGPIVDRTGLSARRRWTWILSGQLGMATCAATTLVISSPLKQITLMGALFFLQFTCIGLFDVAIDGMAVRITPPEERARANAVMFSGQTVGIIASAIAVGFLLKNQGFRTAMLVETALLSVFLLVPVFWWRRSSEHADASYEEPPPWAQTASFLKEGLLGRTSLLIIAGFFVLNMTSGILNIQFTYAAVEQWGWESEAYTSATSALGLVSILGLILGSILADRIGHIRSMLVMTMCSFALSIVVVAFPEPLAHHSVLIGYQAASTLLGSMAAVTFFAVCMAISHPKVAATQFTFYMAGGNLTSLLGGWIGGEITGVIEFHHTLAIALVFGFLWWAATWKWMTLDGLDWEREIPLGDVEHTMA